MTHKDKCKELKKVRKNMADQLGIDLHQRECTYQGECSGTCPKCRKEEETLNKALLARGAVAAMAMATTLAVTGCGPQNDNTNTGKVSKNKTNVINAGIGNVDPDVDQLVGEESLPPDYYELEGATTLAPGDYELEGDVAAPVDDYEGGLEYCEPDDDAAAPSLSDVIHT